MKKFAILSLFALLLSACGPLVPVTPEVSPEPSVNEYQDFAYDIVWSQDDSMVALTTNLGLYVYDTKTSKQLFSFDQNGSTVVFGKKYMAFVNWQGLFVYDLNGFKLLFHEEPTDGRMFGNVAISPDDKLLAAGEQDRLRVWSLPDMQVTQTISTEDQVFWSHVVFKGNTRLAVVNTYYGTAQEWDVSSGKLIHEFGFDKPAVYTRLSRNGQLVLVDYGMTGFQLWDVDTGKLKQNYGDIVSASGFQNLSGDNHYAAVWGYAFDGKNSGMSVWDLDVHIHVQEFTTPFVNGDGWRYGALNSDGSILAAAKNEGYIYLYNVKTGEKLGEIFLPGRLKTSTLPIEKIHAF
jgi:WD40 repeat protein